MDLLLLIVLIVLFITALGIGFLLGRRVITKKNELQLEFTYLQYSRSEASLDESNSALKLSKKQLDIFKKTSIKEFEKLKTSLELTRKELTQAQSDLVKAGVVAGSDSSDDSIVSALPSEERRTDIRRADEKQAAIQVDKLLSAHMRQFDLSGGSGDLGAADVADDFFVVDTKTDKNGSAGVLSKPEPSQEGNGKLHEQEALITQYNEKARKQSIKIDVLLAENEALQQSVAQAKNELEEATTEIKTKDTQLAEAGKSAETLRKRKDNAELSVEALRDENAGLKKTANEYKEQFKTLKASVPNEAQLQEIELDKESQQKEIHSLTRKLHHADRINNELQQRSLEIPKLESQLEKLDELNTLSEQQASQIASLSQTETQLKEQNDELRMINSEYLHLERDNESLSRENVKLRVELDRIPGFIKESNDARSQVNELTGLVENAQQKEDGFNAKIESALKTEAELREELEKAQRSLTKPDDYHVVTQRLESLQAENRKLSLEINNFDELTANYQAMRDRNDELVDQINQFERNAGKLQSDIAEFHDHNASRQAKDEVQLDLNIELSNEKPERVNPRKAEVKKKVAAKPVGKKAPKLVKQNKKKKASASKLSAKRKAKSKLKLQEKDDLKAINGIGPKLEKLLNSHGIRTFEQLACLSKSEADDLAIKIGTFGERITRDKWVSKAKRLVKVNKKAA